MQQLGNSFLFGTGHAGAHALADKGALNLGQRGHDVQNQFACGRDGESVGLYQYAAGGGGIVLLLFLVSLSTYRWNQKAAAEAQVVMLQQEQAKKNRALDWLTTS